MNMKKVLAIVLAVVLLMTATIAGTIAWLMDDTQEVKNTFTVGNINITLEETGTTTVDGVDVKDDYKIIPGNTEAKDPKVTVEAGSEACYVFIQIEELNNYAPQYIKWTIASDWLALETPTTYGDKNYYVYYRKQSALTTEEAQDASYYVLAGDEIEESQTQEYPNGMVYYPSTLNKDQIDALYILKDNGTEDDTSDDYYEPNTAVLPSLTFKAFAVQQANMTHVNEAWAAIDAAEKLDYVPNTTT